MCGSCFHNSNKKKRHGLPSERFFFCTKIIPVDINIHFNPPRYFLTSLRCLKSFHEDLKGLHKTYCGATKKCEIEVSVYFIATFSNARTDGKG